MLEREEFQFRLPEKISRNPPPTLPPDTGTVELSRYVTPTGLNLEDVGYREWHSIGQTLFYLYEWTPWAIGDWINYGERVFGETYAQAASISGRKVRTLYNLSYIARKIPPEMRVESLDIGHHDVVAPLPDEEKQRFLKEAERLDKESGGNLTVPAFREYVRENRKPQTTTEPEPTQVMCTECHGTGWITLPKGVKE